MEWHSAIGLILYNDVKVWKLYSKNKQQRGQQMYPLWWISSLCSLGKWLAVKGSLKMGKSKVTSNTFLNYPMNLSQMCTLNRFSPPPYLNQCSEMRNQTKVSFSILCFCTGKYFNFLICAMLKPLNTCDSKLNTKSKV